MSTLDSFWNQVIVYVVFIVFFLSKKGIRL